jgi:hypothetical protein
MLVVPAVVTHNARLQLGDVTICQTGVQRNKFYNRALNEKLWRRNLHFNSNSDMMRGSFARPVVST